MVLAMFGAAVLSAAPADGAAPSEPGGLNAAALRGGTRRPEGLTSAPYDLETYETSVGSTAVVRGDPATFELFGFKLGMSVREADRNARQRHLRFNGGDLTAPSFDGRVNVAAARLLGRKIPTVPRTFERTSLADAAGNHYKLIFLPMEAGATLASVAYYGSPEGNTSSEYLAALEKRFGRPTHRSIATSSFAVRWCSKGDQVLALCDELPALAATGGGDVALDLLQGNRARRDLDKRIEAKATAVASAQRKAPSF